MVLCDGAAGAKYSYSLDEGGRGEGGGGGGGKSGAKNNES